LFLQRGSQGRSPGAFRNVVRRGEIEHCYGRRFI